MCDYKRAAELSVCREFPSCSTCACGSRVFRRRPGFFHTSVGWKDRVIAPWRAAFTAQLPQWQGLSGSSYSLDGPVTKARDVVYGTVPCGEKFRLDSSAITPGFDGVFRHHHRNIWTPAQKLSSNLSSSPLCFNEN